MSHTPGPWSTTEENPCRVYCDDATGSQVAVCAGREFSFVQRSRQNSEANARLIAAAPDLLAMVQQYASECGDCDGDGEVAPLDEYGNVGKAVPCESCSDIRALIVKATSAANGYVPQL